MNMSNPTTNHTGICERTKSTIRWSALACAAGSLAVLLPSCALSDGASEDSSFGSHTQAFGTPALGGSGADAWRNWSGRTAATDIDSAPAVCSNHWSPYFVFTRNTDQRYYVKSQGYIPNPAWKQFGFRQFVSAPSCVYQKPLTDLNAMPTDHRFLVAGKSTDSRIYVVEGISTADTYIPNPPDPTPAFQNPDWTGPWGQVSGTPYSSGNGEPALGSDGDRIVVTFLDAGVIRAHVQELPFVNSASAWSGLISGPAMPAGVTAQGVPAITYMGGPTNRFVIMVRGSAGTSEGLYWIFFDGTSFIGDWTQLPTTEVVDSDPALEWDGMHNTITAYFRTGSGSITQISAHQAGDLGVYPSYVIDPLSTTNVFLGAPRVAFGATVEASGVRLVVTRGYDLAATPESERNMTYLSVQDNTLSNSQCDSESLNTEWSESDVDCGGDFCSPCENGKTCNVDPDCESRNCESNVCSPAPEPESPCDGYCTPAPISFDPEQTYQSGSLGFGETCRELSQYFDGLWCGNFSGGKQLVINGQVMNCTGGNLSAPPPENGGYCIQSTAGAPDYAAYALWDTTQGDTEL